MLEAVPCAPEDAAELVDWIEVRSGRYVPPDFRDRIRRMIRIAIAPAAYAAIAGTLPGNAGVERGRGVLAKLKALRG
jgi:hypothetical protein